MIVIAIKILVLHLWEEVKISSHKVYMTSSTVISYPIPAYQNLPINANFYSPSRFLISDIDLGTVTTITTTENINYVVGQEVRLIIPAYFGSYQLNEAKGFVIEIPALNQVVLNIDSSQNVDAFVAFVPPAPLRIPYVAAQILAIGDVNNGAQNSQGNINNITYPLGAFINISPE